MPNTPTPTPTTFPCPACGRPVERGAALCTQCGQQLARADDPNAQLQTRLGAERGLPPIPAIAPGPAAFRDPQNDPMARAESRKPLLVLIVALSATILWKLAAYGHGEAGDYLLRYAITTAGALVITSIFAAMIVEVGVSAVLAAIGVAAAVAGGDLVQHALHYTYIPTLAWMAAIVAVTLMLADFLELDLPDAVYMAFAIYLLKWVLKIYLFDAMFESVEGITKTPW